MDKSKCKLSGLDIFNLFSYFIFRVRWLAATLIFFFLVSDTDMGPLTLASTITPLSSPGLGSPSGLENDSEIDAGKFHNF